MLFFSFILNVFFLSLVRIPFFIAPKLSQNNFKNQIVWEVLVGEVLVVGEVEKRAWILEDVHFIISAFPAPVVKFISARFPTLQTITVTRLCLGKKPEQPNIYAFYVSHMYVYPCFPSSPNMSCTTPFFLCAALVLSNYFPPIPLANAF